MNPTYDNNVVGWDKPDRQSVQTAFKHYIQARKTLLAELQLKSNRDPLAEFSEWLVMDLVGGVFASSRVQEAWDVQTSKGERIQVKYLANAAGKWVNEHTVKVDDRMDSYGLIIFEDFWPQAVLIFPVRKLAAIGTKLGKRHDRLGSTLQFTQANYRRIVKNVAEFENEDLGLRVYLLNDWQR